MTWRPWHLAWQEALYGEHGFYRAGAGPAAHFSTSMQGIPGANVIMAQTISQIAQEHPVSRVVDLGCGRGELLAALLALRGDELDLVGVDVVARPDQLDARIGWWISPGGPGLPDQLSDLRDTLVVANEWLDNVPCVVAGTDDHDTLRELEVDNRGRTRLGSPLQPADRDWVDRFWPVRAQGTLDVGRSRDVAWSGVRARIVSGALLAIDYGHLSGGRPEASTVVGYRGGALVSPRLDGSTDVTAHVAMDSLGAAQLRSQREVLRPIAPPAPSQQLARANPAGYVQALAARSAWAALTDPGGLGGFWWALQPVSST